MASTDSCEPTQIVFRRMIARVDLHPIDREQWRAVCRGAERQAMQSFLRNLADAAQIGTQADRLALLKAAYAVLPLHGSPLNELAELLTREPTPACAYADALVEALAQQPRSGSSLGAAILATLRRIYAADTNRVRAEWIAYHTNALGHAII